MRLDDLDPSRHTRDLGRGGSSRSRGGAGMLIGLLPMLLGRKRWLRRGLEAGDPAACDTFSARES